ncbi:amidohydrolase family protein [uncultured Mailhella sp.]|uniref:amidohydrolase family protein n=1 Tax=uncultured Mailhella sp. TaxID=1981031 RepID=UPI0025F72C50|nr:amidohydrolase family protein [uncultured Mailhella sp.]
MIIDFRVRPPFKSNLNLAIFGHAWDKPERPEEEMFSTMGREAIPSADQHSVPLLMEEMAEVGVTKAVLMGRISETGVSHGGSVNADSLELTKMYPDIFQAFVAIEPRDPHAVETIEEYVGRKGFKGVCIDPSFSTPPLHSDDAEIDPVYRYCEEHGIIVSIMQSGIYVPDMSYADPLRIERVAIRFPRLTIIVPHACWPFIDGLMGVAMVHRNIYLLPDCYAYLPGMCGVDNIVNAGNHILKYRMLYASSYPVRGIKQSYELWTRLGFTDEALRLNMYENAARLLQL